MKIKMQKFTVRLHEDEKVETRAYAHNYFFLQLNLPFVPIFKALEDYLYQSVSSFPPETESTYLDCKHY